MFSRLSIRRAFCRTTKPVAQWRFAGSSRYLSSISHHDEQVSVPVGGNGTIDLTIYRPTRPTNNNDVLVHLPPGPLLPSSFSRSSDVTPENLKDVFPTTTIVDVQYRISLRDIPTSPPAQRGNSKTTREDGSVVAPDHRFPTPIHDVFTAWEYITDKLELYNHDIVNGDKVFHRPRICLLGSHIGGGLALSLALTNPESIVAVALMDGMVDWVGLDELATRDGRTTTNEKETGTEAAQKEKRRTKALEREAQRLAARELIRLRRRLFRSHSGYFDAFASPVLFLRAPGRDTPTEPMGDVDMDGKGEVMRYGDGTGELAIVAGGNGYAYGPYDDDWQAHLPGEHAYETESNTAIVERRVDEHRRDARSSIDSSTTVTSKTSSTSSSSADTNSAHISTSRTSSSSSSPEPQPTTPRRRKVLRRWPPTAYPEDVLLPYINIFTTTSLPITPSKTPDNAQRTDITPVLNLQATELQDLLRKACFWGREKSVAEERVNLMKIDDSTSRNGVEVGRDGKEVFGWLRERFDER